MFYICWTMVTFVLCFVLIFSHATCRPCRPPYDSGVTYVDWKGCGFNDVPEDLENIKNVTTLDLSENELQIIMAGIFENLTKLEELNLSENADLIIPLNECFLISNSLKCLNISYIPSISINSTSLSCLPNIAVVIFIGNHECPITQKLFEGTSVTVCCKRNECAQYKDGCSFIGTHPSTIKTTHPSRIQGDITKTNTTEPVDFEVPPRYKQRIFLILLGFVILIIITVICYVLRRRYAPIRDRDNANVYPSNINQNEEIQGHSEEEPLKPCSENISLWKTWDRRGAVPWEVDVLPPFMTKQVNERVPLELRTSWENCHEAANNTAGK